MVPKVLDDGTTLYVPVPPPGLNKGLYKRLKTLGHEPEAVTSTCSRASAPQDIPKSWTLQKIDKNPKVDQVIGPSQGPERIQKEQLH